MSKEIHRRLRVGADASAVESLQYDSQRREVPQPWKGMPERLARVPYRRR
jgi:hypothetical protein